MHAIAVDSISFGYDPAMLVVRDVSLTVRPGEFLSLVGPNGSGKTTLLRLLDRIYVPQKGTILLGEHPLAKLSRADIARRIAFVPQDKTIQFPFTVAEIVLMGRSPHTRGMAFENAHDRKIAEAMMALTDVADLADKPVTDLSGGERQRVFIARALAQQPEIILLDEPNAHLDIAHQVEVFRIIRRLNRDSGLTVLSVSHDLNLAAAYSDRIAMMVRGTLSALGTPAEVLTGQRIHEVFGTQVIVDTHPVHGVPRVSLLD
ncbi:MAG TPA: ABC transporter ATP-binding protein [Bacteroidota bacterium]|nr:ABC transporter ATP-binding protein [Bacteroidota bacterium]